MMMRIHLVYKLRFDTLINSQVFMFRCVMDRHLLKPWCKGSVMERQPYEKQNAVIKVYTFHCIYFHRSTIHILLFY